jgi:ATP-dependent protease ClpP protease subunit
MAMSLRKLPKIEGLAAPGNLLWKAPNKAIFSWAYRPLAAVSPDDTTITMFVVIGEDWTGADGVTAKRIAGALRSIGPRDVTVKINSPGGDMFEGIAIYNLLRNHSAKVQVEVLGLAASAASIIAMAGDEVKMGIGSSMMIHNAWGAVVGDKREFFKAFQLFGSFDAALADIYEARTQLDREEIVNMMDAETFMSPSEAIDRGFADGTDANLQADEAEVSAFLAWHWFEANLEKAGLSNFEHRRNLIDEAVNGAPDVSKAAKDTIHHLLTKQTTRSQRLDMFSAAKKGTRDAAPTATHDAGLDVAAVERLIETIRS